LCLCVVVSIVSFFFSSRRRHTRSKRDWSSDVCSSDLDIRQMGYEIAVPVKGDRVFLMDERINLDHEIRVQAVKTTYDERDNIIGCEVTFGSESIRQRYKASINSLSKNFRDLIEGKLKLPIISLEQIGMDMIKNIHDAS